MREIVFKRHFNKVGQQEIIIQCKRRFVDTITGLPTGGRCPSRYAGQIRKQSSGYKLCTDLCQFLSY